MKCIVTGGSGFIGTHLVQALLDEGREVLNIDTARPRLESHLSCWKERDILDREALIADFVEFAPEAVVHLAARTDTLGRRLEDYEENTRGTENVLDAIKATGSIERAIITSTQFVNQYRGAPAHDLDFAPHTVYGESKVLNEKATRAAGLACAWTITRPTNIWGPWHPRYPHEFWKVLARGFYFHPGGGDVIRSYGYVKNVVFQNMAILDAPREVVDGRVFYLGDRPLRLLDWVNGFSLGLTGRKARVIPRPLLRAVALAGDLLALAGIRFPITSSRYRSMTTSNDAPMDAVFEAFGEPPYSLQQGIDETVDWLRAHHPNVVRKTTD